MTRDDIKKALAFCNNNSSCDGCPYEIEDIRNCSDTLKLDARTCIIKQEQEIAQLKDSYAKLQEQFAQYQMANDKEIAAQVKQAKIDVLNKLKENLEIAIGEYGAGYYLAEYVIDDIDELLREYEQ